MVQVWAPRVPLALLALICGLAPGCDDDSPILDAGMADVGLICTAPEEDCGGMCVDTTASTSHCGGCDVPCDPGEECIASGCRAPCTAMAPDRCGIECVDTSTSNDHCGSCDEPCGSGYACTSGRCLPDCQEPFDSTVVEITGVSVDPSSGSLGTVFQITLRYSVLEPVDDLLLTLVVIDLDANVLDTVLLERSDLAVGDYTELVEFDSSVAQTGFHRATLTLCTPQGGDRNGATFRVN